MVQNFLSLCLVFQRYNRFLFAGAHDHHGLEGFNHGNAAYFFHDQLLIRFNVAYVNLQQKITLAGNVVALGNFFNTLYLVQKSLNGILLMKVQRDLDKGFDTQSQFFLIHQSVVTFNVLGVLQFAHTLQRWGGRQADFIG